jgi:hypothetical protein
MTLKELSIGLSTDKESTHHYLDVYENMFKPFKNKEINIIEVGYATGGSIELWEKYFIHAHIWCIDIDSSNFKENHAQRVDLWKSDISEVNQDWFNYFKPDIAIDDGSHFVDDQIAFFNIIWPNIKKGGYLIIEDIDNLEKDKHHFDDLGVIYQIVDLRKETGHHDSVLLIFKK